MRVRVCILAVVGLCCTAAHAKNEYLFAAGLKYPDITTTSLYDCSLCHASGDNRNPFGQDFEASDHNFDAIENVDSDHDGFSNVTEIDRLTWPGNPLSFPFIMGTINVLKPKGGESWSVGTKALVTWESDGDVGDDVSIELWRNGEKVATLKDTTPNDGKQKIKIKGSWPRGSGFKVRVRSLSDLSIVDECDASFSIVKG